MGENDENGTDDVNGVGLLPKVGQPTIGIRFVNQKQKKDRTLLVIVSYPYR